MTRPERSIGNDLELKLTADLIRDIKNAFDMMGMAGVRSRDCTLRVSRALLRLTAVTMASVMSRTSPKEIGELFSRYIEEYRTNHEDAD